MALHMLTTIDNPFNPFTEFDEWRVFDETHHYNTLEMLARIAKTSYELSDADQDQAVEDAIDEIIMVNASGMWTKVAQSEDVGSSAA